MIYPIKYTPEIYPANVYLLKVAIRTKFEICSVNNKDTRTTPLTLF